MVQPVRARPKDERQYNSLMRSAVLDPYFATLARSIDDPPGDSPPASPVPPLTPPPLPAQETEDREERDPLPTPPPPLPPPVDGDAGPFPAWLLAAAFPIAASTAIIAYKNRQMSIWHQAATQRTLGAALNITIPSASMSPQVAGFMAQWQRDNIALISSLPQVVKDDLARRVARIPFGDRAGLSNVLASQYRVTGYRLRLITRDQTTKYVSGLNQIRQTSAGVNAYIWVATRDERVRPDHWALNGQRFLWSSPPPIGHPGDPINCRCVARPDVRPNAPPPP